MKKLASLDIPPPGRPLQFAVADSFAGGSQHKLTQAAAFESAPAAPSAARPLPVAADKEGTVAEENTRERVYFPETWLWDLSIIP